MNAEPARSQRAEAIVRSIARALDPYVALFMEQPEEGFVCGFCGEERGEPHSEPCPWYAATLFVMTYPDLAAARVFPQPQEAGEQK